MNTPHPNPNPALPADPDLLWQTVLRREARRDFVYGVRSTGIYCYPDCPARRPRRANVVFFADPAAARAAGLRACRRCKPDALVPHPELDAAVARACRLIAAADAPPTLAGLAQAVNLGPGQLQRRFKAQLGVSPRAYGAALRDARLREGLSGAGRVMDALLGAGFESASRAYAATPAALGMTPGRFRAGGAGETICHAVVESSLGWLLVAATARGICAVQFGDTPEALRADLHARFARATHQAPNAAFSVWVRKVVAVVDEGRGAPKLPLDIRGTAFQCRVWAALRALPVGTTATYGELAARVGAPGAARAVGSACGANALAVLVPCHRAVPMAGGSGQYRWGSERKRRLLAREGARVPAAVGPGRRAVRGRRGAKTLT